MPAARWIGNIRCVEQVLVVEHHPGVQLGGKAIDAPLPMQSVQEWRIEILTLQSPVCFEGGLQVTEEALLRQVSENVNVGHDHVNAPFGVGEEIGLGQALGQLLDADEFDQDVDVRVGLAEGLGQPFILC
jgi:hypothetical protein